MTRFENESFKQNSSWYIAITVLRILWLRDNEQETWDKLNKLMDHLDDNMELDKTVTSLLKFINDTCGLTQFTEKEILHVIGNEI